MPRRGPKRAVTRLPRASTMLYRSKTAEGDVRTCDTRIVKEKSDENDGQGEQRNGTAVAGTNSNSEEGTDSIDNPILSSFHNLPDHLVREIEARRLGEALQTQQVGDSILETLRHDMEQNPSQVCSQLNKIVGDVLFSEFETGNKDTVGHLSKLLDLLSPGCHKVGVSQDVSQQGGGSHFYMEPEEIGEALTFEVDERVIELQQDKQNAGGRKRKDQSQGQKTIVAAYGSLQWNLRIQSQLCYLLRVALSQEHTDLGTCPFSSNFQKEALKVRDTGASQGMQLIGATLEGVCKTLEGLCFFVNVQLKAFTKDLCHLILCVQLEALLMQRSLWLSLIHHAKRRHRYTCRWTMQW